MLSAAASRPDLVPHAIVLGTSSVVGRAAAEHYRSRAAVGRSGDSEALTGALREDTAASIDVDVDVDVEVVVARRLIAAVGTGHGYANAAAAMARMREEPLSPRLGLIESPVDVIGAEHDALCPRRAADLLLDGLRDGRYHEVLSAGHLMLLDNPDGVDAVLKRVLDVRGSAG